VAPTRTPHMRLARDLAGRMRYFGVTEAYASFELEADERELVADAYDALAADATTPKRTSGVPTPPSGSTRTPRRPTPSSERSGRSNPGGKEPLRPRVRFLDRNATDGAFEALIDAVEGEKRVYEGHIDSFDLDREAAEELARQVEVDNGGYGFLPPSSIYHRFMTGLTGGKMSSSIPASHISLLDDPDEGYDKVKSATTGGRETAEKQRELGGEADDCPVYELYAYLLSGDDDDLATRVYEECVGGDRLCGGCKEQAAELMAEFLEEHQEKREEAKAVLADLDIELESDRTR